MIETEFVLGGLEAVFDSPATAFHRDQFFRGRALGAPGGEERHSTIGNVAADQQPSRPLPGECAIVLRDIEVGEFQIGPVVQAWILIPSPDDKRRQRLGKALCDLGGGAADKLFLSPGADTWLAATPRTYPLPALRSMVSMSPVP